MMAQPTAERGVFDADRAASHAVPFVVAVLAAFALVRLSRGESSPDEVLLLVAIASGAALAIPWIRSQRLPDLLGFGPPVVLLAVAAFLRDLDGGSLSAFSALLLLPILWLSLHGTRRQLLLGIAAVAAGFALPIVIVGSPKYPAADWETPAMWLLVSMLMGLSVQTVRRDYRDRIQALATESRVDTVTGLPNRRAWNERLPVELERAKREGAPLALLILDFDRFKTFNDSNGHQAGDRLLRESAEAWTRQLRATDLLARYGGDEFCLVLPNCTPTQANSLAKRLQDVTPYGQSVSIGLAHGDGHQSADALLAFADSVLYACKRHRRDAHTLAMPQPASKAVSVNETSRGPGPDFPRPGRQGSLDEPRLHQ